MSSYQIAGAEEDERHRRLQIDVPNLGRAARSLRCHSRLPENVGPDVALEIGGCRGVPNRFVVAEIDAGHFSKAVHQQERVCGCVVPCRSPLNRQSPSRARLARCCGDWHRPLRPSVHEPARRHVASAIEACDGCFSLADRSATVAVKVFTRSWNCCGRSSTTENRNVIDTVAAPSAVPSENFRTCAGLDRMEVRGRQGQASATTASKRAKSTAWRFRCRPSQIIATIDHRSTAQEAQTGVKGINRAVW